MEAHEVVETEMKKVTADRTSGIVCVKFPHCRFDNQFPEFDDVDVFICDECGEPVVVEEPVQ